MPKIKIPIKIIGNKYQAKTINNPKKKIIISKRKPRTIIKVLKKAPIIREKPLEIKTSR